MIGKYSALDISRYIINRSHELGKYINNLQLQNIMYLVQAVYMDTHCGKEKLFCDEIVAWSIGPVVESVYREYCFYGSNSIPYVSSYFDSGRSLWNDKRREYDSSIISEVDRGIIDGVLGVYLGYSSCSLARVLRSHEPWASAYRSPCKVISCSSMYLYYKNREGNSN